MDPTEAGSTLYITFVNAFSYTIAVATVDRAIDTNQSDLLVIAVTIGLGIGIIELILNEGGQLQRRLQGNEADWMRIAKGPVAMGLYTLTLAQRIAVHFLSTVLGKWAITTTVNDLNAADTLPTVGIAIALLWLLGAALGFNAL